MGKLLSKNKLVLLDLDYTLFDTDFFKKTQLENYRLYQEVDSVLTQLREIATLAVFSEGNKKFQKDKVRQTNLKKYFKRKDIHVFLKKQDKLEWMLEKYKDFVIFMADDKLSFLETAKKIMPSLLTIWIKRGPYAERQKPLGFLPDATFNNLEGIVSFVKEK